MVARLLLLLFLVSQLIENSSAAFLPKQFEAEFIQIKKSRLIKKVDREPIKLTYKYPAQIRLETSGANKQLYVCNQNKVWVYTPPFVPEEKGQMQVGHSSKYCFSKIFDALQKGETTNDLYKVENKKLSTEIFFTKDVQKQIQIKSMEFFYNSKKIVSDLDKMVVEYTSEQPTLTLKVKSISKKSNLDKELFIFKAPENTEITQMK